VDAYNVQAYNLVNLRYHLSSFKTLQGNQFVLRMDEREAALYGDVVLDLLQQAKSQLCEKYGLELGHSVIVELRGVATESDVGPTDEPAVP
jgi:hypothetical protein